MEGHDQLEQEYKRLLTRCGVKPAVWESGGIESLLPNLSSQVRERLSQIKEADANEVTSGLGLDWAPANLDDFLRGPFVFSSYIGMLAKDIEDAISDSEFSLLHPVYAGEFPTSSFNAMAYPCKGGSLALVNTGLCQFVARAMKLVAQRFGIGPVPNPSTFTMSQQKIGSRLGELVFAYLHYDKLPVLDDIKEESSNKTLLMGLICYGIELFALAHEYGHAIAGHLDTPKLVVCHTPVGEIEVVNKTLQEEADADQIATGLLLEIAFRSGERKPFLTHTPRFHKLYVDSILAGPFLFFALDELINNVNMAIEGADTPPAIITHPPSGIRAKGLREVTLKSVSEQFFKLGDVFTHLTAIFSEEAVSYIRNKVKKGC